VPLSLWVLIFVLYCLGGGSSEGGVCTGVHPGFSRGAQDEGRRTWNSVIRSDIVITCNKLNNSSNPYDNKLIVLTLLNSLFHSGGQKQRIAVARAILKNPPILVFDEATSALDAESEYHVSKAMAGVMRGRTVISIAHRLSTIRQAHRVALLQDGIVEQSGQYQELVEKEGAFKQLVSHQL